MSYDSDLRELLERVKKFLVPLVEETLQASFGGHWREEVARRQRLRIEGGRVVWDAYALLRCVVSNWKEAFARRFPPVVRNYVGELLDTRNFLAHDGQITPSVLRRARETAALLAAAVGIDPAPLRERARDEVSHSPAITSHAPRSASTSAERAHLLAAVEKLLSPPVTKRGAWRATSATWRAGIYCAQIGIGVDALEDGRMRVHLFTDEPERVPILRSLASRAKAGELGGWPGEIAPGYRRGDKGNRTYFGFAWSRAGGYLEELPIVAEQLRWFAAIKKDVEAGDA